MQFNIVRACSVPPAEAFDSLPAILAPPDESDVRPSSMRASAIRPSSIVSIALESQTLTIDQSLKCMVLPKEEARALAGKSLNPVTDAMSNREVNLKDILIAPQAGFVIVTKQTRPVCNIIINVTHHPSIGRGTVLSAPGSTVEAACSATKVLPTPVPFTIGRVVEQPAGLSVGLAGTVPRGITETTEMIVDIVLPSSVIFMVIEDATGDMKEEVSFSALH